MHAWIKGSLGGVLAAAAVGCSTANAESEQAALSRGEGRAAPGKVERLNPEELFHNPAYSQGIAVSGRVRTVYVGGQNAVDGTGAIVGAGNIREQTTQALQNAEAVLNAGGAELRDVVKWNIHLLQGQPLQEAFESYAEYWGANEPPAVTASIVSGLANPEYLIEIDAIAIVPES
ncbi:MAG: RidA family protein [Polyangiales bacterium]